MSAETPPNENVQAVIDYLTDWTGNEVILHYHNGDQMTIEITMKRMFGDTRANVVEWLVDHDWMIHKINMEHRTITMAGPAFDIP